MTKNQIGLKSTATAVAIILLIALCFSGVIAGSCLVANASTFEAVLQDVQITSYAPYMTVGEEMTFRAANVYYDADMETDYEQNRYSYTYEINWSVSEEGIVEVSQYGVVTALAAGKVDVTATSAVDDTLTATVTVEVLDREIAAKELYISAENLVLSPDQSYTLSSLIVPTNATSKDIVWTSSEETVATVENGVVSALANGETVITATLGELSASCNIKVQDNSILDKTSLELQVGQHSDLTVTLPEGVEATSYAWSSSNEAVASPDANEDEIGTITAWSFGSTIITVTVETADATYVASCNVLVNEDYFYLTGLRNVWPTFETADAAAQAGLLMEEVAPSIYQITMTLWAEDTFQIIHSDIDIDWTTKITPYWYDAEKSSDEYVSNTLDMFMVNRIGVYTIVLDLTGSAAKVSIVMDSLEVTALNLIVDSEYDVLQYERDTAEVKVEALPEGALYNPLNIEATVTGAPEGAIDYSFDEATATFTVELLETTETAYAITFSAKLGEATGSAQLAVAPTDAVLPTDIRFGQAIYYLNVNNGGLRWSIPVTASVDADATVKEVIYSSDSNGVYFDTDEDGNNILVASRLGTFTITATALGDPSVKDQATVVVYSSAPYIIGILHNERVNDWAELPPTTTSLTDTLFANWGLLPTDETNQKFENEFVLYRDDEFSIVFLGMPGTWEGNINWANLDQENSSMDYLSQSDVNVKVNTAAKYRITLDLSGDVPSFTVVWIEDAEEGEYNQYLYILRAGDSWDSALSDVGNVLVSSGEEYITVDHETAGQTLTITYNFALETPWPTFQFVTATGASGGGFEDGVWYNSDTDTTDITIGGTAYGDTEGLFYNGGSGCQFWLVGSSVPEPLNLTITVTFNAEGGITAITLDFAE